MKDENMMHNANDDSLIVGNDIPSFLYRSFFSQDFKSQKTKNEKLAQASEQIHERMYESFIRLWDVNIIVEKSTQNFKRTGTSTCTAKEMENWNQLACKTWKRNKHWNENYQCINYEFSIQSEMERDK